MIDAKHFIFHADMRDQDVCVCEWLRVASNYRLHHGFVM